MLLLKKQTHPVLLTACSFEFLEISASSTVTSVPRAQCLDIWFVPLPSPNPSTCNNNSVFHLLLLFFFPYFFFNISLSPVTPAFSHACSLFIYCCRLPFFSSHAFNLLKLIFRYREEKKTVLCWVCIFRVGQKQESGFEYNLWYFLHFFSRLFSCFSSWDKGKLQGISTTNELKQVSSSSHFPIPLPCAVYSWT
jgi:hypothetical protein